MKKKRHEDEPHEPVTSDPEATAVPADEALPEAAYQGSGNGGQGDAAEYKDRWLRAEAELQDYRRRARREIEDARRNAEETILLELIRWLDDLERALGAAREDGAAPAITDGLTLVLQKGRDALERHGVAVVDPAGKAFDPTLHEAILEVDPPADIPPGHVAQVVQKGYRRGERPLRAARVVVARATHDES